MISLASKETFRFTLDQPSHLSFDAPIVKLWTPPSRLPSPPPSQEPPSRPVLLFDISKQNIPQVEPRQPSSLYGISIPKPVTSGPFREKSDFMKRVELDLLEKSQYERRHKRLKKKLSKLLKLAVLAGVIEKPLQLAQQKTSRGRSLFKTIRKNVYKPVNNDNTSTFTGEKTRRIEESMSSVLGNLTKFMTLDAKNPETSKEEKVIYTQLKRFLLDHYMITKSKSELVEKIVDKLDACCKLGIDHIQSIFNARSSCNDLLSTVYRPTLGRNGIYLVTLEWILQRGYPTLNIVPKAISSTGGQRAVEARRIAQGNPSRLRTGPDNDRYKHIHVNGNAQDNMVVDTKHNIKVLDRGKKTIKPGKGNAILGYVDGHIDKEHSQNVRSHNNLVRRQASTGAVLVGVDSEYSMYEVET